MAAIARTDTRIWHGSSGVLTVISERLEASGEFPRYRRQFQDIIEGWQTLDIRDMNAEEIAKFRAIVLRLMSEVRAKGPAHYGEVTFKGFLARLTELEALLQPET